jgi:hypothetical protein
LSVFLGLRPTPNHALCVLAPRGFHA